MAKPLHLTLSNFLHFQTIECSYLHHETDNEDHGHAGHNVRMVLYNEFMTEYRWIFVRILPNWLHHSE